MMKFINSKERAKIFFDGKNDDELHEYIKDWSYVYGVHLTKDQISHIMHCIKSLVGKLFHVGYEHVDSFIISLIENNFRLTVLTADPINTQVLHLYASFLSNYIPINVLANNKEIKK